MCTRIEPGFAFVGLDKEMIIVSFTSSKESSTIPAIEMVPDVAPALIVRVPLAKV